MSKGHDSTKNFRQIAEGRGGVKMAAFIDVAVQRKPNREILCACAVIPAEMIERFADDDTRSVRFCIDRIPTGFCFRYAKPEEGV